MSKQIQRFAFVPLATWEQYGQERFPDAVEYKGFIAVNYDSPEQSDEMLALVAETGIELVHHEAATTQMIIDGINAAENKIYNCELWIAQEVAANFNISTD